MSPPTATAAGSEKRAAATSSNAGEHGNGRIPPTGDLLTSATHTSKGRVTLFKRAAYPKNRPPIGIDTSLSSIIEMIRSGEHSAAVSKLRALPENERMEYKKRNLPCFCAAGTMKPQGILVDYQNRVVIDIDHIPPELAEAIRDAAKRCPEVIAGFVSPGGRGVKLIWCHNGGLEGHRRAWELARDRTMELGAPEVDDGSDPGRFCFISSDDGAFYQELGGVLEVSPIDAIDPIDELPPTIPPPSDLPPNSSAIQGVLQKLERQSDPAREHDQNAAEVELSEDPHLKYLYRTYLLRRIDPKQGTRNTCTNAAAKFLFQAVSEEVLRLLLSYFYRINQLEFLDSHEEHMRDVDNMLRGISRSWLERLNMQERAVFDRLDPNQQVAFRICRDLGTQSEVFHLGQLNLAKRLSPKPNREAGRAPLKLFRELELIELTVPGLSWNQSSAAGLPRTASKWRWNHEMFGTVLNADAT